MIELHVDKTDIFSIGGLQILHYDYYGTLRNISVLKQHKLLTIFDFLILFLSPLCHLNFIPAATRDKAY